jgi:deoxyribodipyrimidine photo-lyase
MTSSIPQDIDRARYRLLLNGDIGKGSVLYWMSREQRAHDNWGLLLAQQKDFTFQR